MLGLTDDFLRGEKGLKAEGRCRRDFFEKLQEGVNRHKDERDSLARLPEEEKRQRNFFEDEVHNLKERFVAAMTSSSDLTSLNDSLRHQLTSACTRVRSLSSIVREQQQERD